MSTLMSLTQEVSTQLASVHPAVVPMAGGDGILDWLTLKNSQTQTLLRGVAITLGVIFVVIQGVSSRGAMARIIISLIAAGIFVWGVYSVTDIKDRIENEVNAMGPQVVQVAQFSPLTAAGPYLSTS